MWCTIITIVQAKREQKEWKTNNKRLRVKEFSKLYKTSNLTNEFSIGEVYCGTPKSVGNNVQRNLPDDQFFPSPTILEAEVVLWLQRWAFLWLWIVGHGHLVHPLLPSHCPALCTKASAASTSGCPLQKCKYQILLFEEQKCKTLEYEYIQHVKLAVLWAVNRAQ